jgi:hypothetical protein
MAAWHVKEKAMAIVTARWLTQGFLKMGKEHVLSAMYG